jgi:hypothetical protein
MTYKNKRKANAEKTMGAMDALQVRLGHAVEQLADAEIERVRAGNEAHDLNARIVELESTLKEVKTVLNIVKINQTHSKAAQVGRVLRCIEIIDQAELPEALINTQSARIVKLEDAGAHLVNACSMHGVGNLREVSDLANVLDQREIERDPIKHGHDWEGFESPLGNIEHPIGKAKAPGGAE